MHLRSGKKLVVVKFVSDLNIPKIIVLKVESQNITIKSEDLCDSSAVVKSDDSHCSKQLNNIKVENVNFQEQQEKFYSAQDVQQLQQTLNFLRQQNNILLHKYARLEQIFENLVTNSSHSA